MILAQLLVALTMPGARPATVEAVLTRDSVLLLPARDVAAFVGAPAPAAQWTTIAALRREWPSVSFTWDARAMAVYVDDPLAVLPATRAARAKADRQARGAPTLGPARSGPFLALTADDAGRQAWEAGFSYRGRAAASARQTRTGTEWGVSLAPSSHVFASWTTPGGASARLAAGPAWASASWQGGRASLDALVAFKRVAFFASTRDAFALTISAAPLGVQVGRTGRVTTARLTYGPTGPSPFSPPQVP